jgi:hypothetical protein
LPKKQDTIKIGMCSDAYLSHMHHSEYRMNTFIGRMKNATPDFIIELGDFATPAHEYKHPFDIWNSFPSDKYPIIG